MQEPLLGLACRAACLRGLDSVGHRIAKQVLQRSEHAFEHRPVEFDPIAVQIEPGLSAGVAHSLPDDAMKSLGDAREPNHPDGHEVLLKIAGHLGLQMQIA